eukprot:UN13050
MFIEYGDDTGPLFVDYDMLTQYIQEHGPVIPQLDGRIKIVDDTKHSPEIIESSEETICYPKQPTPLNHNR